MQDPAGSTIAYALREKGKEVLAVSESLLYLEDVPDTDLIIFASRHSSASKTPSFTVHSPGNFHLAEFGGEPFTLGMASAIANRVFLEEFQRKRFGFESFNISLEVTHHGPLLGVPSVFVELGSSSAEWENIDAARLVADVIVSGMNRLEEMEDLEVGIGFGGGHYAPKFTKYILNEECAVSHICPNYHMQHLNRDLIDEMLRKTAEDVEVALIDWKGMKKIERDRLIKMLDEIGIDWRRI
ncbi:MAG: Uncharacterized conserved protein UCP016210 [Candidatus Syntrophoarchaeum caldarius]|uniref:D-tyrosyl-tRNA(Tyr) deacylase n=1 Tax=Candidatus Syntropharchaeum caldarium TaxID=1838285 RepID=A0A1F2PBG6_9EURY|nr:MAG: Uncharacterized conserved protein UCP016210 [Candidatus Syntrophoarchaeum caldarius]